MAEYPSVNDNDISLLKKVATNTAQIADGSGGGGGGAVDSVNGQTGVVVLGASDVGLGDVDNTSDTDKPISDATQSALDALDTAIEQVQPAPSGNRLRSGGGVAHTANLSVMVAAAEYTIQGVDYSSAQTDLTAGAADGSNPRIDLVVVNSSGAAVIVAGTAAANPVEPAIDPTTQLKLAFLLIPAAGSAISVSVVNVYLNNAEYTATQSGGHINLDSTTNPNNGAKDIEGTAVVAGDYFQLQAPGNLDLANYNNLVFFIRSKATWASQKQLTITARNSTAQVGAAITFKDGTFGFNSSTTASYQVIVIPCSLFNANGLAIDRFRWTCAGGGAAIGFYVDDITLQGGIGTTTDSTRLRDRGTYSSTLSYEINDLASNDSDIYKCIQAGTGRLLTNTVYWVHFATRQKVGSHYRQFCVSFNPKAVCDLTIDRLFLMTVGPDCPNGLKIARWNVSFDADPATEADLDLKRADAFIGVANSAVMDVLDTTNGAASETVEANINSGNTVANGKVIYLEFGTAYSTDNLQINFQMWYYAV